MAFNLFRISIISVIFFLLSERGYFRGDRYFRDVLIPVTFYRYFWRFATVEGSLLSELYGNAAKFCTTMIFLAPVQKLRRTQARMAFSSVPFYGGVREPE